MPTRAKPFVRDDLRAARAVARARFRPLASDRAQAGPGLLVSTLALSSAPQTLPKRQQALSWLGGVGSVRVWRRALQAPSMPCRVRVCTWSVGLCRARGAVVCEQVVW